jgi:3-oxoadipate enol-lactonase
MASRQASLDHYLPVTGALLRYRDEGSGPATLLIHGWTLDLDMWQPQVAALADSFRLIRFDRRGFGLSSGSASVSADVGDVLSLCDQLQVGRLACVGMSQGARVALHLCRIAPERLACVVLDGPPRILKQEAAEKGEDVPLAECRRWASHLLMQLETRCLQPRQLLQRMTARYSGKDLLQQPPVPEDDWDRAVAASLRTAALILTGEHDLPPRLRAADALSEALPRAQRSRIAAARHIPNLDNPPLYNAVLRAFLERHAGSRR